MEMSLDDIIATRPKTDRRNNSNRGKARAQVLGTPGLSPATRARAKATPAAKPAAPASTPAEKIIVSNLPQDVNEAQVKELFHTTVGPLREVTLHYDAAGRSKGVATVLFSKKGDGNRAFQQYNNRLIDGRRPMKIEIVVDPSRPAPPATLASRVAPVAATNGAAAQTNAPRLVDFWLPQMAIGVEQRYVFEGMEPALRADAVDDGAVAEAAPSLKGHRRLLPIWMLRWRITRRAVRLRLPKECLFLINGYCTTPFTFQS